MSLKDKNIAQLKDLDKLIKKIIIASCIMGVATLILAPTLLAKGLVFAYLLCILVALDYIKKQVNKIKYVKEV